MKTLFTLLAGLLVSVQLYTQDPTWFTDVSEITGIEQAKGSRVWIADVNGDDYPDLLTNEGKAIRNMLHLFINTQDPESDDPKDRIFVEYTEESGINAHSTKNDENRFSDIAALADVDNDGDIDLVASTYFHRIQSFTPNGPVETEHFSEVLLNDGNGNFTIVENSGLHDIEIFSGKVVNNESQSVDFVPYFLNTTGISFLDYDNDGNLDMYFGTWFVDYANNVKMRDLLLRGDGTGRFTHIKDNTIQSIVEPMYGTNVTDWNNDGWQDIITSGYCRSGGSLFKNNGDGTFTDASNSANYSGQHMGGDHDQPLCQWEANPGDFDNDGDMDLLQVSVHGGYNVGEGRTTITVNQGADDNYRYEWALDLLQRDADSSFTHVGDMGGAWIDINYDGFLDVVIGQLGYEQGAVNTSGQTRLYVMLQNEEGYFIDITKDLGLFDSMRRVHSLEPIDFDLDGDLDLIFTREVTIDEAAVMQMTLLRNDYADRFNWSAVKLDAPEDANQSAIGARIYFYSGDMMQIRDIQAGAGHFAGQSPFIINAGIENRNRIDSIIVRWPNADLDETKIYNPTLNIVNTINVEGNVTPLIPNNESHPLIAFSKPYIMSDTLHPDNEEQTMSFSVINTGSVSLEISDFELVDDFNQSLQILNGDENITLDPQQEYMIEVKFDPEIRKDYFTTIKFTSNAFNGTERHFDVYGIGYEPSALISTLEGVSFPNIFRSETKDTTITIKNTGEIDLVIDDISIEAGTEHFQIIQMPDMPATVNPDKTIEIEISFVPNGASGDFSGSVNINSNAYQNEEYNIALSANAAVPYPKLKTYQTLLSFGVIKIPDPSTRVLTIQNEGDTTLVISDIDVEDSPELFAFINANDANDELPFAIEAGESFDINVILTPEVSGSISTNIDLLTNDPEASQFVIKVSAFVLGETGVAINLGSNSEVAKLFPNPAENSVALDIEKEVLKTGSYRIHAVNLMGSQIYLGDKFINFADKNSFTIDIKNLLEGYYMLTLTGNEAVLSVPFIKVK